MSDIQIPLVHLQQTDSTNAWLRRQGSATDLAVYADEQTAGRGQRGNVWVSQPGSNLLFSLLWHPVHVPAVLQFAISEAAALAVCDLLHEYGVRAEIKWPNDIYVHKYKICGILIEHAVGRSIESSIIGIGLNINQSSFPASLPNPISICEIVRNRRVEPAVAAESLLKHLLKYLPLAETEEGRRFLHSSFLVNMYRNDGRAYPYHDVVRNEDIQAIITDVLPDGHLQLTIPAKNSANGSSSLRTYAFKEIEFKLLKA